MIKRLYNNRFRRIILILILVSTLMSMPIFVNKAEAFCCRCCQCWAATVFVDFFGWIMDWIEINLYIYIKLYFHQLIWFDQEFWQMNLLPAMAAMGEQLAAVGMQEMYIIGAFLDATEQLETQRQLQVMQARAHKDYHPSLEVCEFGSRVKSLATSERKAEIAGIAMSKRSIDRMFGNKASIAPSNRDDDISNRLIQFQKNFCYKGDNNGALEHVCIYPADLADFTSEKRQRLNKDIDYVRTLAHPRTLNVDFTNDVKTDNEEEILALGTNIYGFNTFQAIDPILIENNPTKKINPVQEAYLDLRSYVAKQNVAENSFNALVSLKSEGTAGSKEFLKAYLEKLDIPASEIDKFIGANPSYHAQMEILTKLAYQTPSFYTHLYDKPANVERKGVALQAIGLMQKFDLWKSYLRTEVSLSVLLELKVQQLQGELEFAIEKLN